MRYDPIQKNLVVENRRRLVALLQRKALRTNASRLGGDVRAGHLHPRGETQRARGKHDPLTETGPVDLMADIPIEADEIEALMARQNPSLIL